MTTHFAPSPWKLEKMIEGAMDKFDRAREAALSERFERAVRVNRQTQRDTRSHDCRRHVFVGDSI